MQYYTGGMESGGFAAYIPVLIMFAFYYSIPITILFLMLSLLNGFIMAYLELYHLLPTSLLTITPFGTFLTYSMIFAVSIYLLYLATGLYRQATEQYIRLDDKLRNINYETNKYVDQLETREISQIIGIFRIDQTEISTLYVGPELDETDYGNIIEYFVKNRNIILQSREKRINVNHENKLVDLLIISPPLQESRIVLVVEFENRVQQLSMNREIALMSTKSMIHDFKNILNVIRLNAEILEDVIEEGSSQAKIAHQALQESLQEGQYRIKNILKPNEWKEELKLETIENIFTSINIKIRASIPPNIKFTSSHHTNCTIKVNYLTLREAIINLILNAIDAIENSGYISFTQECVYIDSIKSVLGTTIPSGRFERFTVEDNGIPIPTNEQFNIFIDEYTTKEQGTGQGLPSVLKYARENNGFINLETTSESKRFHIYIPHHFSE